MTKAGRLLVPWYRYPPFRKQGIGGLSVAVWELTRELAGQGVHVDVLTPPMAGRENKDYPPGLSVSNSVIGEKFLRNELLERGESRYLDRYDAILSVANYGARTLCSSDRAFDRVSRQIHTIGHDRDIDTYVSLKPSILEYLRMFVAKRKEEKNEKFLVGHKSICVSCYLIRKMRDHDLEASERLFWIPNGIQTRLFRPTENEKIYDLLFVGRFQKAKGVDLLLSALRMIQNTKGEVYKLAIAGEFTAEQRSFLRKTVPAAVRERIVFLGTVQREDLPNIINSSKLVVVSSRYEAFGLPALEAIACGVPVLATKVGGLPEIIDESVGLLVEPDYEALGKAIYTSISDASLTERAAINGPERAERYDWRIVAPRIIRALFPEN